MAQQIDGFQWPETDVPEETQILADVREHGVHVVCHEGSDASPPYGYTVGLYLNAGHPEVLVIGLPPDSAADVLTEVTELVGDGSAFAAGDESSDVLRKYSVRFVEAPPSSHERWLGKAQWFYSSVDGSFPSLQLLWPTQKGRFPGDKGLPAWMKKYQPVAGS
jgi:hypothetical protein